MADGDSGIIVTQQGVDVRIAADYQKVMDTRWRFLDIALEQEFTVSHADSGGTHYWIEKICDHGLGYLPAFYFRTISIDYGGLNPGFYNGEIIATKSAVYWRNLYVSGDPTAPIKLKLFVRVFACDISTEYQAPINFIVPASPVQEPDIGIKVLKGTGDIRSTELSNFSIDSQGKALAIQQTGTRSANAGTSFTLTIVHGMGYPPTYFLAPLQSVADFKAHTSFANPLNEPIIRPMTIAPIAKVFSTSTTLSATGVQSALSGDFAFLITKEPTELAV